VRVPVDKIGEVIGPKGKVINQIQDDTGATLSIEDDGTVYIGATNGEAAEAAKTAVNATANPTIVHDVWRKDPAHWRARAREIAEAKREWTEAEIAWAVVEEMSLTGARLLEPTFVRHGGRKGRLSMQTQPNFRRTPARMLHLLRLPPQCRPTPNS